MVGYCLNFVSLEISTDFATDAVLIGLGLFPHATGFLPSDLGWTLVSVSVLTALFFAMFWTSLVSDVLLERLGL